MAAAGFRPGRVAKQLFTDLGVAAPGQSLGRIAAFVARLAQQADSAAAATAPAAPAGALSEAVPTVTGAAPATETAVDAGRSLAEWTAPSAETAAAETADAETAAAESTGGSGPGLPPPVGPWSDGGGASAPVLPLSSDMAGTAASAPP